MALAAATCIAPFRIGRDFGRAAFQCGTRAGVEEPEAALAAILPSSCLASRPGGSPERAAMPFSCACPRAAP